MYHTQGFILPGVICIEHFPSQGKKENIQLFTQKLDNNCLPTA